jgi:hypothetical protein
MNLDGGVIKYIREAASETSMDKSQTFLARNHELGPGAFQLLVFHTAKVTSLTGIH